MSSPSGNPILTRVDRLRTAMYALGWRYSGGAGPGMVRLYFVRRSQKMALTIEWIEGGK